MEDQRPNFKSVLSIEDVKENQKSFSEEKVRRRRKRNVWKKRLKESKESVEYDEKLLEHHIMGMSNNDVNLRKKSIKFLRIVVSKKKAPVGKILGHRHFLPSLEKALTNQDSPEIQSECAWIISNVSSFEYVNVMLIFAPYLILFVGSARFHPGHKELVKNCLWALGNMAADSEMSRMRLIKNGVLGVLSRNLGKNSTHVVRTLWCLSRLCFVKNQQVLVEVFKTDIVGNLMKLLDGLTMEIHGGKKFRKKSLETLIELLWALVFVSSVQDPRLIMKYVDLSGRSKDLLQCLLLIIKMKKNEDSIMVPALRVLANLLCGPNVVSEAFFKIPVCHDVLSLLVENIQKDTFSPDCLTIKESALILSNISGGNDKHSDYLIKKGLLPIVCKLLSNPRCPFMLKRELLFILINLTHDGRFLDKVLIEFQALTHYLEIVKSDSLKVLERIQMLNYLLFVLQVSANRKNRMFFVHFERLQGIRILNHIAEMNPNENVKKVAMGILVKFFSRQDSDMD